MKGQLAEQVAASQSLKRGHPTRECYKFRTIAQFASVAVCRLTSHTWNMISVVEVVGVIVVEVVWVVVIVVFVTGVLIDDVVVVVVAIVYVLNS